MWEVHWGEGRAEAASKGKPKKRGEKSSLFIRGYRESALLCSCSSQCHILAAAAAGSCLVPKGRPVEMLAPSIQNNIFKVRHSEDASVLYC